MSKDARPFRSVTAPSGAPDIRAAELKAVPARASGWMINLRRKLMEVQAESDQLSERARESLARALEMIGSAMPSSLSMFPGDSEDSTDDGFGAIPGLPAGLNLKSPADILKNEKLETLEAIEDTKQKIESLQKDWEAKLDKALGKGGVEQIKGRIDTIKNKAKSISGVESLGTI